MKRIVFMGTPDFAVPCLQALLTEGYEVVGVFTQPDKPKGRGHKMQAPPVKELALAHDIPVFQPTSLREDEVYETLCELAPDLIVVVAYGKILPKRILDLPPLGCINIHGSLLPKYRGAAPIQWSVLNGETETGVTSMYMAEGLDTGDMLWKKVTPIGQNETAAELFDRLSVLGAQTLLETLQKLEDGTLERTPQRDEDASYAPMLSKDMAKLSFDQPAKLVHQRILGLSDWPCAVTTIFGKRLKIYRAQLVEETYDLPAGSVVCPKTFVVVCGDGHALRLTEVQWEGSKRMEGAAFLRGRPVEYGTILGA